MIRSSQSSQPVYREILKHAVHTAWYDRRYWILSLLAGILVTAGSYDVLWKAFTAISSQGQFMFDGRNTTFFQTLEDMGASTFDTVLSVVGGIEVLMLLAAVMLVGFVVSCAAQGGLVFALGARRQGHEPTLGEAFKVGGSAFWPVAVLNLMAFALIWILRFMASFPLYLALNYTTATTYLVFLLSFAVFLPLSFLISIVQIFTLSGVILQGATLGDGVRRGYLMFKKHWVVVVETAVIQTVLSLAVWLVLVLFIIALMIPAFMMIMTAAVIQSGALFSGAMLVGSILMVCAMIAAAAFTIQLQYATWTYMYRRLGEGGVVPKIHRIVRNLTGIFTVPQR